MMLAFTGHESNARIGWESRVHLAGMPYPAANATPPSPVPTRDPARHAGPVQAAAFIALPLHRVLVVMCSPVAPRAIQRERVENRSGAGIEVEVVEAAQHRLGMRPHRGRVHVAPR